MGLIMNHKKSSGLPTNGLIAYYPFNGNTNDYSGNNRHLINVSASPTTDRHGNANKAYYFNGSAYMYHDNTDWDSIINTHFTISLWKRLTSTTAGYSFFLTSRTLNTWYNAIATSSDYPNGRMTASINYNSNTGLYSQIANIQNYYIWRHLVIRRNNNLIAMYVDGNLISEISNTYQPQILDRLAIGANYNDNANAFIVNFTGDITKVRIYNQPLTIDEITALANE